MIIKSDVVIKIIFQTHLLYSDVCTYFAYCRNRYIFFSKIVRRKKDMHEQ